ncbi:acyl-CoA dehydrogenase family protein [Pantoea sp. 1.19]|uniref:acyl-CoA dehydrogenase family protein n=1 Tax=Pantoea sp. 1.19 TaxID=1925589 RepID=UPI000948A077|nr:acyl-CoA dehydrogenase family protein [Pantoea sp. 1.19]
MFDSLEAFRQHCRAFLAREAVPFIADWERDGCVSRTFWLRAGEAGLLGLGEDPRWGGGQQPDFHYAAVLTDELIRADMTAPVVIAHNDVIASYISQLGSEEQKQRWLPGLLRGELIAAIAVTEPQGGSDAAALTTAAVREGDHYVVNGQKAFITNGVQADLVLTAVRTSAADRGQGISLLVIERHHDGFSRSAPLEKLGWHASDTANLTFQQCRVPCGNLLGKENLGNLYFMGGMPRERLSIATVAVSTAERLLAHTLEYVKQRRAFGQSVGSFQSNRFRLAELDTEVKIARIYLNDAIASFNARALSVTDAARVKLWTTELQWKVADACLQLHGGSGYLRHGLVGKTWVNSRVQTLYGGTSEVMKELISKSMGL